MCASVTSVYFAVGVVAKVGGSELHKAPSREHVDRVAELGSKRFRDRISSLFIWSKHHVNLAHLNMFGDNTEMSLTNNLKLRIFSSEGQVNGYHEVTITTFRLKSSCTSRVSSVTHNWQPKGTLLTSYLQESVEMLCLSTETAVMSD